MTEEEIKCSHCNCTEYYTKKVGPHIGAYCERCNRYIKWLKRPDKNLVKELIETKPNYEEQSECDEPPW